MLWQPKLKTLFRKYIQIQIFCTCNRAALEKKAELYNHLADGVGTSQLADRFLVDFQTKKQGEVKEAVLAARRESTDDDTQSIDDLDNGW